MTFLYVNFYYRAHLKGAGNPVLEIEGNCILSSLVLYLGPATCFVVTAS
jgi:hypothetical protein